MSGSRSACAVGWSGWRRPLRRYVCVYVCWQFCVSAFVPSVAQPILVALSRFPLHRRAMVQAPCRLCQCSPISSVLVLLVCSRTPSPLCGATSVVSFFTQGARDKGRVPLAHIPGPSRSFRREVVGGERGAMWAAYCPPPPPPEATRPHRVGRAFRCSAL